MDVCPGNYCLLCQREGLEGPPRNKAFGVATLFAFGLLCVLLSSVSRFVRARSFRYLPRAPLKLLDC